MSKEIIIEPVEGHRERKRRATRARIAEVAMALFRDRGFANVTLDDIARGADISKPTFFNYYAAKEDVVLAWQDKFAAALAEAIEARPADEPLPTAIANAMAATIAATATPESFAMTELIRQTPALRARNQAKYGQLEARLFEALQRRAGDRDLLDLRMMATVAVGALRVGTEEWERLGLGLSGDIADYSRAMFGRLWSTLASLGADA